MTVVASGRRPVLSVHLTRQMTEICAGEDGKAPCNLGASSLPPAFDAACVRRARLQMPKGLTKVASPVGLVGVPANSAAACA